VDNPILALTYGEPILWITGFGKVHIPMAYDQELSQRIRELLADQEDVVEKQMFGGIAFMVRGNVACGLTKQDLLIRIGPERNDEALAHPHARPMDFTGKPMKGWIYVSLEGYETDKELAHWVQQGVAFALSLPPK
jgi:TfoX/Sxy family transcriptional regulator of competence genes